MSIDVSVVVPVYNTEEFLPECVESLIGQTLRNVEFIFVDDGSTDHSVEILEQYQQRDDRIRILRQKNLYAGVARNNGLEAASGKYIMFLDSDDFFERTMLESAFRCAEDNQAEIVAYGYYKYDNFSHKKQKVPFEEIPEHPLSFAALGGKIFLSSFSVPWNKLLLRSFVVESGIKFQSTRTCNDEFFDRMILTMANRFCYLKRRFVYYRVNNSQSLQGTVKKRTTEGVNNVIVFLTATKRELKARSIYKADIRSSFCIFALRSIKYRLQLSVYEYNEWRCSYDLIKQHLIPDLFDSPDDFSQDRLITNIYNSQDFNEFLYLQIKDTTEHLQNQYISKKSIDYRLGHAILRFPRWIKQLITR